VTALASRGTVAAAVRDDLDVSGEQLAQSIDVAFPERVEEACGRPPFHR
jgi:hypothetical protein